MRTVIILPLILLLAGCSAGVPGTFSSMDFGIGCLLKFSGPERRLMFVEDDETLDYGRDYRITLIVDGGSAARVALSGGDRKHPWSLTPQYWDRKNRAVVDIDGRPYPLVEAWQELAERDQRFILVNMHGRRCGDGAALSVAGCPEQTFYLRTTSGVIQGPFIRPKGGAPLCLGADYTVIRPQERQLECQAILENIILPDVDFRRVKADEAISFLDSEFKRLAPGSYLPIRTDRARRTTPGSDTETDDCHDLPSVSWTAAGISLLDALEITCRIADLQFYIEHDRIAVSR